VLGATTIFNSQDDGGIATSPELEENDIVDGKDETVSVKEISVFEQSIAEYKSELAVCMTKNGFDIDNPPFDDRYTYKTEKFFRPVNSKVPVPGDHNGDGIRTGDDQDAFLNNDYQNALMGSKKRYGNETDFGGCVKTVADKFEITEQDFVTIDRLVENTDINYDAQEEKMIVCQTAFLEKKSADIDGLDSDQLISVFHDYQFSFFTNQDEKLYEELAEAIRPGLYKKMSETEGYSTGADDESIETIAEQPSTSFSFFEYVSGGVDKDINFLPLSEEKFIELSEIEKKYFEEEIIEYAEYFKCIKGTKIPTEYLEEETINNPNNRDAVLLWLATQRSL